MMQVDYGQIESSEHHQVYFLLTAEIHFCEIKCLQNQNHYCLIAPTNMKCLLFPESHKMLAFSKIEVLKSEKIKHKKWKK